MKQKAMVAALGTLLLWAFAFPASKAMLAYFTAEQVVLLRYIVACMFYAGLFVLGFFPLPRVRDLPVIFVLGLLGITVYQILFVYGLGRVTAGAGAMIVAANPVFVSLLARMFLGEKLSKAACVGIGISVGGVAVIAFEKGIGGELVGYLMLIVAVFSIAIYFTFQKPLFARYSPLSLTAYTSIAGTLPLLFFLPEAMHAAAAAPTSARFSIIIMGIFSSGIGFLLWFYALSKLKAGVVASFLFLQPVLVSVMAWFWLSEIPTQRAVLGGVIILLGVTLILVPSNVWAQLKMKRA